MLGALLRMSGGWSLTGVTVMLNISVTATFSLSPCWREAGSRDEEEYREEKELVEDESEENADREEEEEESEE